VRTGAVLRAVPALHGRRGRIGGGAGKVAAPRAVTAFRKSRRLLC
jgi:hypothetical protein